MAGRTPPPPGRPRRPAGPRLDRPEPGTVEPELAPDTYLSDLSVTEVALAEADTETCDIGGCTFTGGSFADSRWHRSRWVDSTFDGVDLANTELVSGSWERLVFADCRMVGVRLAAAALTDVELVGCSVRLANLRQATLRRVRLVDCTLVGADLTEARCTDVEFVRCDLADTQWSNPGPRRRLRLEDCELARTTGLSQLRGLEVAGSDPTVLAYALAGDLGLHLS
ncbi:pentapeptide repeat-containing protein [Naumannella sp. ID2617S]|nr:pentapeptide repeat-containing protein [Naumannella sp. ID2617S]